MSTPATPTTARRVPVLGDNGRFDDEYTPQAVLDAVTATDGARAAAVTAQGKAEEAQQAAEEKAQELADAKGAAGGIGSLTDVGRQPDSEVNANLTPQALLGTFVAVRTSDNKALPPGTVVVITLDKTLAQVTATPVADIADITFTTGA